MGDSSTHAVFHGAYWHLCFKEHDQWVDVKNDYQYVCSVGDEDALIELKR